LNGSGRASVFRFSIFLDLQDWQVSVGLHFKMIGLHKINFEVFPLPIGERVRVRGI